MGLALQDQGKLEEAIAAFEKAISIKPGYYEAYNNIGNALRDMEQYERSINAFRTAVLLEPDFAEAYNNMGNAFLDIGAHEKAIGAYNQSILLKPNFAEAYNNLGNALKNIDHHEEAFKAYNHALKLKPDYAEVYNNIGDVLADQGKVDEAVTAFQKAILLKHDYTKAHRNLSRLKKYRVDDPQIQQMEHLYSGSQLGPEELSNLCFALGKASEDIGKLDLAFRYFKEGNSMRRKIFPYDIYHDETLFLKIKQTSTTINFNALLANQQASTPCPIFVLGMPRSGTTLIEQILSCHSKICAGGELDYIENYGLSIAEGIEEPNKITIKKFRNKYLEKLKFISQNKNYVIDKTPQNFRFIGLIISAFPEARIIHVKRSPAAVCWSNYKRYFEAKNLGYCFDLEDIVRYYQLYRDLMNFWDRIFPNYIYHLNYEKLTLNQFAETTKLMQYLNVGWEDDCLFPHKNTRSIKTASQQQVREKIYKGSSKEWEKFKPFLNGVFNDLEM